MHKRKLQSMKITALNLVSPYLIKAGDTQELLLERMVKTQTNQQKNSWIDLMGIAFSFFFSFPFFENLLVTKKRNSLSSTALFTLQECDQEINALSRRERYHIVTRS